jgi:micrococcal nuclease
MFEYKCVITKIIDGDTVDVDIDLGFDCWLRKQRIRLYGIDTPESRTRDKQEKRYGLAAKRFVENFIPVGSSAILKTKEKGKYGRYLGDMKVGSKWLCKALLDNHHAVKYFGQSKKDIKKGHLANRKLVDVSS